MPYFNILDYVKHTRDTDVVLNEADVVLCFDW